MERIRLPRGEWFYDPDKRLGAPGGFGVVFAGHAEGYGPLAVKRIKLEKEENAHRELRVADELIGRELRHVMPTLDAGRDEISGSYFLVMPQAEKSLQAELDGGKTWTDTEAATVLLEIARGLSEVSDMVHRDLKPANVLYHQGKWKIADFGIARFVEEATSPATLRRFLSDPYAAPEQWRSERATAATDIYALGCIGYAVLTGRPPFPGPNREQFRQQHVEQPPPPLEGRDATLASLLLGMLSKSSQARPSLSRVIAVLSRASEKEQRVGGPEFSALVEAGAEEARRRAESEARTEMEKSEKEGRNRLAQDAFEALEHLLEQFFRTVLDKIPEATRQGEACITLGRGKLVVKLMESGEALPSAAFSQSGWNVVAGATIHVEQSSPRYVWGASLWYSKLDEDDGYRWREVSYSHNPLLEIVASPLSSVRFALDFREADQAAGPAISPNQIAWGPHPIDYEESQEFFKRWAQVLAKAAPGQLHAADY